jgi:hypothetical protein
MSGGIRALSALRDELLQRGYDAWLTGDVIPVPVDRARYERRMAEPRIGIYPEAVPDNRQNFDNIVRWKLNRADNLPEDGLTFSWHESIGDHPLLRVNVFELDLWKPYAGPRGGVAYWVGKGKVNRSVLPEGCEEITQYNYTSREALAERIRTLDFLISFDPFTAMAGEAVLCGTPCVILGSDEFWNRESAIRGKEDKSGIAWSMDDLDQARATVGQAYEEYTSQLPLFAREIDNFVETTQTTFG